MILLNLYGGPGTGKSTTAAATFAELKYRGVNCEYATEFAKDKVWEKSLDVLGNQPYILGKQFHRLWRLQDLDVVITDSPLLMMLEYGNKWGPAFQAYVLELHNHFPAVNCLLQRPLDKRYNPRGRVQTQEKAQELDRAIEGHLNKHDIDYIVMLADRDAPKRLADIMEDHLEVDHIA